MNNDIPAQSWSVTTAPETSEDADDSTQVLPVAEAEPIDLDADDEVDPFTDNLSTELDAAASKTWRNRATTSLGVIAVLVIGFLGGVLVQKNYGNAPAAAATNRGFGGAAGFAGGFGRGTGAGRGTGTGAGTGAGSGTGTGTGTGAGGGSSAGAGASQTGVIKLVDGNTIYVQLANGDVVTVRTSDSTKVSLATSAKVSALKKGQQVTFSGSTDSSSGTVTATSVTASPASAK